MFVLSSKSVNKVKEATKQLWLSVVVLHFVPQHTERLRQDYKLKTAWAIEQDPAGMYPTAKAWLNSQYKDKVYSCTYSWLAIVGQLKQLLMCWVVSCDLWHRPKLIFKISQV